MDTDKTENLAGRAQLATRTVAAANPAGTGVHCDMRVLFEKGPLFPGGKKLISEFRFQTSFGFRGFGLRISGLIDAFLVSRELTFTATQASVLARVPRFRDLHHPRANLGWGDVSSLHRSA